MIATKRSEWESDIIMNEEDIISLFYAKSHKETRKILFPLAEKGNKVANYFMGNMLISPIDQTIAPDISVGLSFMKSSASANYSPALEFLGNLYAYSEIVKNDTMKAHTFFYMAANIENKVDLGYHLILEDEFEISEADINNSKENARYCLEVGLEQCELLSR